MASSFAKPKKSQSRKSQRHVQRKEELKKVNVELKKPSSHDFLIEQESKVNLNNLAINKVMVEMKLRQQVIQIDGYIEILYNNF